MSSHPEFEVLQVAIKTEEDGLQMYRELAEKTELKMAKETFKSLELQEVDHIKYIKDFYKNLEAGVKIDNLDHLVKAKKNERKKIASVFTKKLSSLKNTVSASADDLEAYKIAIDFELKAMSFYNERKEKATEDIVKKFYTFLYEMEYEHHKMLDSALHYLENPDDWFQLQEQWIVEGG